MVLDFRFGTERAISKSEEKATLESDASYQAWLQLVCSTGVEIKEPLLFNAKLNDDLLIVFPFRKVKMFAHVHQGVPKKTKVRILVRN